MGESRGNMSTLSVHLSRVLEEIGLNELTVQSRRDVYLYLEHVVAVQCEMVDEIESESFFCGSQTEGTTTPGLNSDVDILICYRAFKVVQDLGEWAPGETYLLMLRESTAPGYCRLQLLKNDIPEPEETPPDQGCTYDECNRVVIKNTFFDKLKPDFIQTYRNGPAKTISKPNIDFTPAMMCTSRLLATEKWAERKRNSGWPTASLIKQVVNDPFFLVPVGYKLSPTKNIEWRISTSLAERRLMFSLNIVQIKCFVILKILIKYFVTPIVGKIITSYHCKMALLYCIEGTEADFWREENLLQSITRCLKMLLGWITNLFCPHFIMVEANLFAGKVTSENRSTLQCAIYLLIQTIAHSLLTVSMDGLGHKLKIKLGIKPNSSPILDSIATKQELGRFELIKHSYTGTYFLRKVSSWNPSEVINRVRQTLTVFESRTTFSDKLQHEATDSAIKFLSSLLGSLLASSSLDRYDRIPQEATDMLGALDTCDIVYLLKQASVLHCSGEVEKVEQLCEKIGGNFEQNITYPVCGCISTPYKYSSEQFQTMYTSKDEVQYAHCVMFTPHEINCIPQALHYEIFRAVGDDIHQRRNIDDQWMGMAVVDCLPFLYYLQYMTYRELGNYELSKESLHNLEQCTRATLLSHVETIWNILGQCHEMEKQPVAALHCYRKSLDIRPRDNAANWLVPLLLYRCT